MTSAVSPDDCSEWWSTSISDIAPNSIRLCGFEIAELIEGATLPDVIWLLLRGELPGSGQRKLLEAALVAAVDHGPQAPSIAAARMAATCGVGLNSAVATGVNLLGAVHGGAGEACMELMSSVESALSQGGDLPETVRSVIQEHRNERKHIPGFGHRYHTRDPRRDVLLNKVQRAREAGIVSGHFLDIAVEIEEQLAGANRPLPINIDGATAVIYSELGFEPPLGRGLFVLSRSVGILAHAWEETSTGARIKGPMPRAVLPRYTGPAPRPTGLPDSASTDRAVGPTTQELGDQL